MYQKIILAYDGSLESQQVLLSCKALTQWGGSKVHLLSVLPFELISMGHETACYSNKHNKIEEERCLTILQSGVEQLNKAGIEAIGIILSGYAVDKIIEYANGVGADLIMLGYKHGDDWLKRWWHSSMPKALIEHSPCSVLVVIIK
jgi:nucleotide-binding universal stress UspA family protein